MVSLGNDIASRISSCDGPTEAKASCPSGNIAENADITQF